MSSFNKIIIVGHLGRDPELRQTPSGADVCTLSVATSEKRKDKSSAAQEITTWFRVSCFGKLAEIAAEHLAKGRQVYVEGRLRLDEYTDRDGKARTTLEVTASEIHFIGPREVTEQRAAMTAQAPTSARPRQIAPEQQFFDDDDIPF